MDNLLKIENGKAIPRASIPQVSYDVFFKTLSEFIKNEGFIVQFFAYKQRNSYRLLAVVRNSELYVVETEVGKTFQSLTGTVSEKFHMFEREIAEQYGITPDGHPWLKMVRYHENYTGEKDVFGNNYQDEIPVTIRISQLMENLFTKWRLVRSTPAL